MGAPLRLAPLIHAAQTQPLSTRDAAPSPSSSSSSAAAWWSGLTTGEQIAIGVAGAGALGLLVLLLTGKRRGRR